EVATNATEENDTALAVRAQRKALEHGCSRPDIGRTMLAWYLLLDGQRLAGEDAFAEQLAGAEGTDDEVELLTTLANARGDAGHEADALRALDRALEVAIARGDPLLVEHARAERWGWRQAAGLAPDAADRLAPKPHLELCLDEVRSIGWFPRQEHAAAHARWPELGDEADAYCRGVELSLRAAREATGRAPRIAPLAVDAMLAFAEREALDPDDPATPARLALNAARGGATNAWPPARNEPCWCGSGRKYKRCCGAV
ncbi:MAG: SEC-C domain-containing protein, partial [Actinomycetota bacterium]|nr:SEC-C domain-containing protein [Actinomycetota bacterium]